MNRHSLDKKCLHQTPRRWKRRTYGAGPSAIPARSPPGASVSLPPSIPSSFLLAPLLFTRVFSSRLSTPQVLRKTPSLARLAPFLLLLSASSVSLCILCVSPFYSFSNPYPARRAGCPISSFHITQRLFTPLLLHYTSLLLCSHPLLPFFFPGASSPSSLHVFPILSINSLQCDIAISLPTPNPDEFKLHFPPSSRPFRVTRRFFVHVF